ncbi:hypothetical protein M123_4791 [Bacteroides fragilis str. 3976T8]|uniref:Uncharacterized protein n=1 Tax=Bacteroides fragilis str. 3976T8 TaxID=1339314 RepID=A0A016AWA0_BACFG|nr:hypothetical protein M123_4791 [Bacteroides fragilis str. 3976T8]
MADENSQCDAERKKPCRASEHLPQHDTVHEPGVGHAGADESRQKEYDRLYQAPEGGVGNCHTVPHREAVEHFGTFPVNPSGYLPANRVTFPLKRPSGFPADGNPACLTKGGDRPVQSGQGFREPVFEPFHVGTKNADGLVIVLQRVGHAVFLLHPFGRRECRVYLREIESVLTHSFYRFCPVLGFLPSILAASRAHRRAHSRSSSSSRLPQGMSLVLPPPPPEGAACADIIPMNKDTARFVSSLWFATSRWSNSSSNTSMTLSGMKQRRLPPSMSIRYGMVPGR